MGKVLASVSSIVSGILSGSSPVTDLIAAHLIWASACIFWESSLSFTDSRRFVPLELPQYGIRLYSCFMLSVHHKHFSKLHLLCKLDPGLDRSVRRSAGWLLCSICRVSPEAFLGLLQDCGLEAEQSITADDSKDAGSLAVIGPDNLEILGMASQSESAAKTLIQTGILDDLASRLLIPRSQGTRI